jgi:cysteine desulfurase / selenocysteine lyase
MIDTHQVRKETKGCHHQIYLNNAGASLPPNTVLDVMHPYLDEEAMTGGYVTAANRIEEINQFYEVVATMLHTKANNIAFSISATAAFSSMLSSIPFAKGDVLLTCDDDYVSNHLAYLSMQKVLGIDIVRCGNLENGDLDLVAMEQLMVDHKPKLCALNHVPTNTGKILPVNEVGALCKKYNIWYAVDACQSAGQMPLDVNAIGCDFLSASGRKFMRGPRAAGFLFVSDKALDAGLRPLVLDMRGAIWTQAATYALIHSAKRFEYNEQPFASILGLKAAISYALKLGLENIFAYNSMLASYLRRGLDVIAEVQSMDQGSEMSSIVTWHTNKVEKSRIEEVLKANNIVYGISPRYMAVIDFDKKNIEYAVRFSPHYYNTYEEIDIVLDVVRRM